MAADGATSTSIKSSKAIAALPPQPASRELTISARYLNLPVTTGNPPRHMRLVVDDDTVREFDIELTDDTGAGDKATNNRLGNKEASTSGRPSFWVPVDVADSAAASCASKSRRCPRDRRRSRL